MCDPERYGHNKPCLILHKSADLRAHCYLAEQVLFNFLVYFEPGWEIQCRGAIMARCCLPSLFLILAFGLQETRQQEWNEI
ncbi:hypothetical protein BaRGS_00026970, partial [Batillaria attramentaria]